MRHAVVMVLLTIFLTACGGNQSALNAQGISSTALKDLITVIVSVCGLIWLMVVGCLAWALLRRRSEPAEGQVVDHGLGKAVKLSVAGTTVIIIAFTAASFATTRRLDSASDADIKIVARAQQWWWQFTYQDKNGIWLFQTANELHIPVGQDVRVELEALDVIHSFWIPSLAGKLDMIPGRKNVLTFRADRAGIYRGQCAEFCGLQHSHMAFVVVAENAEEYKKWTIGQIAPASHPPGAEAKAGEAVFMSKPCAACHTIRGTNASGTSGPDLTHVGSRQTLAAGLLDVTRGTLAAWVADPQTIKPGNNMPLVPLTSDELRQVSAYLEGLK